MSVESERLGYNLPHTGLIIQRQMNRSDRELAAHFIQMTGISALRINSSGSIKPVEASRILGAGSATVFFCCAPNNLAKILKATSDETAGTNQADAVASLLKIAQNLGISLTPHHTVISRAIAVVEKVHQTFEDMKRIGRLKDLNKQFAAERKAGLAGSYSEFVRAKKISILEAIAQSN